MTKATFAAVPFIVYACACCVAFFAVAPAPIWAALASGVLVSLCFFAYGLILRAIHL